MTGIGSRLRQAREARGLSIEQMQKITRIKRVFLESIEADRFEDLPGLVQVRGFIRSYANHVGLDADELLAQYDGAAIAPAQTPLPTSQASGRNRPEPVRVHGLALSKPGLDEEPRPGLSLPLPLLIAGAIVLFALGAFLIIRALSGEAPPPPPTPLPSVISSVSQTLEPTPRVVQSSGVSLTLTADEHVWVRITQDGFTAYEGLLKPGEAQSWHGDQQVIVETGNGAALNAAVNGQSVGVLGPRNRVLIRAWESEGEVTPAPTAMRATPSPADTTATPPSSATPAP